MVGRRAAHSHTSGMLHLRAFAANISPHWLVPIHGAAWDGEVRGFPPIRKLRDGEPLIIKIAGERLRRA